MRVMAAAGPAGLGVPAAVALLVPMEAGLPIPIPSDLVILFLGERAASGTVPLWLAVLSIEIVALVGTTVLFVACRSAARGVLGRLVGRVGLTHERLQRATRVVERKGGPALAVGRGTPGLRTLTVIAAGGSGLSTRRALPPLILGGSVFLQLHLFLGYFLGPSARHLIKRATAPALAVVILLTLLAVVVWVMRRGRRGAVGAWAEAACPACLALGALGEHVTGMDSRHQSDTQATARRAGGVQT